MRRVLVVLTVFLGGCVSAQTFPSRAGQPYPPSKPEGVLVFYAQDTVNRPYDVIAEISTTASTGWFKNQGDLVRKAREEAAKLGADAILLRNFEKGRNGDRGMADMFGWVTAIKFSEPQR